MSANKSNEIKLVEEGKKKKRKERGGRGLIPVPTPVNQRNANKLGEQPWMRSSQSNKTFLQSGRCSPLHSCWFVHALEKKMGSISVWRIALVIPAGGGVLKKVALL